MYREYSIHLVHIKCILLYRNHLQMDSEWKLQYLMTVTLNPFSRRDIKIIKIIIRSCVRATVSGVPFLLFYLFT